MSIMKWIFTFHFSFITTTIECNIDCCNLERKNKPKGNNERKENKIISILLLVLYISHFIFLISYFLISYFLILYFSFYIFLILYFSFYISHFIFLILYFSFHIFSFH